MRNIGIKKLLALLLCAVMVSGAGSPALAEDAAAPCPHGSTVTREEAGEAASCTSDGSHTMVTICADCGEELSRVTVTDAALGHDFRESARTEAACDQAGSAIYTCSRCGESYTEEIPAPGHSYEKTVTEPTCAEAGKNVYTCAVCGDSYTEDGEAALGHDYAETDRAEATYDAEGSVTYTCSRCGESFTEVLPMLERPETPFEQTETVDGVKVTVSAAAGVIASDARMNISGGGSGAFTGAAETVLGVEAGDSVIVRHAVFSFTGAEMKGEARVRMRGLGLNSLRDAYPDGEISVYVLRYIGESSRAEEIARRVSADADIGGDSVSFMLSEPGMYDVVTVVRLPEKAVEPAGEEQGEPVEEEQGEPASEEQGEPVSEEQQGEPAGEEQGEPAAEEQGEPAGEEQGEPAGEEQGEPVAEEQGEPVSEEQGEPASEEQGESETSEDQGEPTGEEQGEPAGEEQGEPAGEEQSEPESEEQGEPAGEEQDETREEGAAFTASGTTSAGSVTVTAAAGVFPEGAVLVVSDPAPARMLRAAAGPREENADAPTETVVASYAYEITVTDAEGNSIQPAEGMTATVAFALAEAGDPNLSVRVLHETAGGQEELPAHTAEGAVIAETTGFSRYTVEFYYNSKEYVLTGDSSIALSEILAAVDDGRSRQRREPVLRIQRDRGMDLHRASRVRYHRVDDGHHRRD